MVCGYRFGPTWQKRSPMYYCYNYLIYTCNVEFVCLVNSVNIKKQHSSFKFWHLDFVPRFSVSSKQSQCQPESFAVKENLQHKWSGKKPTKQARSDANQLSRFKKIKEEDIFHPSLCILSLLIRCPTESLFYWKEVTQKRLPWWPSSKESACQCTRCRFDPWVGKTPRRRKWQCTLVLLPRKFHRWEPVAQSQAKLGD